MVVMVVMSVMVVMVMVMVCGCGWIFVLSVWDKGFAGLVLYRYS